MSGLPWKTMFVISLPSCAKYQLLAMSSVSIESSLAVIRIHWTKPKFLKWLQAKKTPTNQKAKSKYNAEELVCSAIVQQYHVMIQGGLEYSYMTNGIAWVLLRVPQHNPSMLYYYFCDPNSELGPEVNQLLRTSVARTLCLCLLALCSPTCNQEWCESAWKELLDLILICGS